MSAAPRILGHRGASAAAPENTVEALALAVRMGADGVELDVRRSADGVLVLHHDPALADGRVVAELTRADLPAWMPTLAEALDACAGAHVNIEVKNIPGEPDFDPDAAIVDPVLALLAERDHRDDVLLSSFHLRTVDRVKALAPGLRTGLLTLFDPSAVDGVVLAAERGHDAIHPHHAFVDAALVEAAHGAGLELNTWTVDDVDRLRELARLGVDGIVTNVPDVAVATLRAGSAGDDEAQRRGPVLEDQ